MIKDYTASTLSKLQNNFSLLTQAEHDLAQANNISEKEEKKKRKREAEHEIETLHNALLKDIPSASYYFLDVTNKADKDSLRSTWQKQITEDPETAWTRLKEDGKNGWNLKALADIFIQPTIPMAEMPLFSFHISFAFTLSKPYLSRDDDPFYIIDNPVKKDKVFRLLYVSPGSYKGALRAAARYAIGNPPTLDVKFDNEQIERLFGTDKRREEEELHAGRLRFFPTFFRQISLEIINPHDRKNGVGTLPIQFETAQGEGYFNLLYFPFDLDSSNTPYAEVAPDLISVAQALQAMFTVYGFGAKTSSGFGTVSRIKDGSLKMRFDEIPESKPVSSESLAGYLATPGCLKPEYLTAEGTFRERSTDELNKMGKQKRQLYERAKKWWERRQEEQADVIPLPSPKPVSERTFSNFQGLVDTAVELAGSLRTRGDVGNEVA